MGAALGEAVDDCDEFLVAVPVTPGELDEVCGSSDDCAPSASCQSPTSYATETVSQWKSDSIGRSDAVAQITFLMWTSSGSSSRSSGSGRAMGR
jgi:hypothetical protein